MNLNVDVDEEDRGDDGDEGDSRNEGVEGNIGEAGDHDSVWRDLGYVEAEEEEEEDVGEEEDVWDAGGEDEYDAMSINGN